MSAAADAFFTSATTLRLSGSTEYFGLKPLSTATPISRFGRSRTWPIEAIASYSLPRKRPTVRALAGDSTITQVFCHIPFTQPDTLQASP